MEAPHMIDAAEPVSIEPDSTLVETDPVPITPELEELLNAVEYYQPLYGVTGIEDPLRSCRDRALQIDSALSPLGNNFRLIDFGSSLGYFPFFFADRGTPATGLDLNPRNTAVAQCTQRLNGLNTTFATAALDLQTVHQIAPGQYDVALLLSILHHITHQRGIAYVAQLTNDLLDRIPTLVLELATKEEDVQFPWRTRCRTIPWQSCPPAENCISLASARPTAISQKPSDQCISFPEPPISIERKTSVVARAGFLNSRYPRSVAGEWVVEIVRSIAHRFEFGLNLNQQKSRRHRGTGYCGNAADRS